MPQSIELSINTHSFAKMVLTVCILVEIAFLLLDYHVNFRELTDIGALRRLFNITREDGLASWFASTQTFLVGLTSSFIFYCVRQRPGKQREALGWMILTFFFIYMAVDDGAMIHERLGTTFRKSLAQSGTALDFFPSYTWQLIFLPVFAFLGLFMFYFLGTQLEDTLSMKLLIVSFSCFGLAVGMDFIEGLKPNHDWNIYSWIANIDNMNNWTLDRYNENAYETLRHFSKSIEEAIEMLAYTILWFLILRHIPTVAPSVGLHFHLEQINEVSDGSCGTR